jgi:hypothetical protein
MMNNCNPVPGRVPSPRCTDLVANRAAHQRVKAAIHETIAQIRAQCPEAADYLAAHIVFDDVAGTVMYTGDDRLKMEYVPEPMPKKKND